MHATTSNEVAVAARSTGPTWRESAASYAEELGPDSARAVRLYWIEGKPLEQVGLALGLTVIEARHVTREAMEWCIGRYLNSSCVRISSRDLQQLVIADLMDGYLDLTRPDAWWTSASWFKPGRG